MTIQDHAARGVADGLWASETMLDDAIIYTTTLPAAIIQARREYGLDFGSIQGALASASEAMAMLVEGRRAIGRVHGHVRRQADRLGVDVTAYGDAFPCPADEMPRAELADGQRLNA